MKIAILSDIHGNSWALESVLADIKQKGINKIYDLGDSLYGPLDPKGTFDLIKEWNINSICGNQDRYIVENIDKDHENKTLSFVLNELSVHATDWLQALPKERVIDDEIYLCHGTPNNDTEYLIEKIYSDYVGIKQFETIDKQLSGVKQKIVLCGHSHSPSIIETTEKTIINPGSVGLPAYDDDLPLPHKIENHNMKARYCILDLTGNLIIEQIAVSYDFEKAAERAEMNKRDDWAKWIRTGRA